MKGRATGTALGRAWLLVKQLDMQSVKLYGPTETLRHRIELLRKKRNDFRVRPYRCETYRLHPSPGELAFPKGIGEDHEIAIDETLVFNCAALRGRSVEEIEKKTFRHIAKTFLPENSEGAPTFPRPVREVILTFIVSCPCNAAGARLEFKIELLRSCDDEKHWSVQIYRSKSFLLRSMWANRQAARYGRWEEHDLWIRGRSARLTRIPKGPITKNLLREIGRATRIKPLASMGPRATIREVVCTCELEGYPYPEYWGSIQRSRVEILKALHSGGRYSFQVFHARSFRVQPTYPIIRGKPMYEVVDHDVYVRDKSIGHDAVVVGSLRKILRKALRLREHEDWASSLGRPSPD